MAGLQPGRPPDAAGASSRSTMPVSQPRLAMAQTSSPNSVDRSSTVPRNESADQDDLMDQDQSQENARNDLPHPTWQRAPPNTANAISRTDRVSRPRLTLALRPLTRFSVRDIPKCAFAHLIGINAPQTFLAEIASHKYDLAGNCALITVYDQEHARRISQTTSMQIRHNGKVVSVPVEVKTSQHRPNTTRGVIEVEPEESNEEIQRWIRCEQAEVIHVQRIGKTNRAVITFDSPTLPKVVKYYMAIVKVTAYHPKRMVCYNCHQIGHMAKHCPHATVCRTCGRSHPDTSECGPTVYCVACKDVGHISVSSKCPSRLPAKTNLPANDIARGVSWANRIAQSAGYSSMRGASSNLPASDLRHAQQINLQNDNSLSSEVLTQLASLRQEVQQLRKENQELKKALAERNPQASTPQETGQPKGSTRRSRSQSKKLTPTSQPRIEPELMQVLNIIRSDIHKERASRQDEIGKIRILFESFMKETSSMIEYITNKLPDKEEPPRKVPPRNNPTPTQQ